MCHFVPILRFWDRFGILLGYIELPSGLKTNDILNTPKSNKRPHGLRGAIEYKTQNIHETKATHATPHVGTQNALENSTDFPTERAMLGTRYITSAQTFLPGRLLTFQLGSNSAAAYFCCGSSWTRSLSKGGLGLGRSGDS